MAAKKTQKTQKTEKAEKAENLKSETNEIDDIFAKKKTNKVTKPEPPQVVPKKASVSDSQAEEIIFAELAAVKRSKKPTTSSLSSSSTLPNNDDSFGDSRGKLNKRLTDDGYPIFDVKDLKIGEGGDTPDCPFDCQCCF